MLHLESLKERNNRVGNHQMVARISAMQEAATATVGVTFPLKDQEPSGKEASHTQVSLLTQTARQETKVSDGVVIKPYVNNILANVTEKIVCATLQEATPAIISRRLSRQPSGVNSIHSEADDSREEGRHKKLESTVGEGETCEGSSSYHCQADLTANGDILQDSHQPTLSLNSCISESGTPRYVRNESLSECGSPISMTSDTIPVSPLLSPISNFSQPVFRSCDDRSSEERNNGEWDSRSFRRRPRASSSKFLQMRSVAYFKKEEISQSAKGSKSLDDLSRRHDFSHSFEDESLTDCEGQWSCQSTPRHHNRLLEHSLLKGIRDLTRARAYILYALSDRSAFTEEITV